ncbi:2Fe-2S ferredoxin-like protein [Dioscorea alata]|uniref:2Fe-2S ferredoxin-like protein n=1 Tax=Dioscorea alata TaxID=55571 RepID=A0ACB7UWZ2_DIOAL|nr:2Fe-2S ferredoxin-like protein [Dioscorea alata]
MAALSRTHSFTFISFSSTSAKVSDCIVKLLTIDSTGACSEIISLTDQMLLKALANAGLIKPLSRWLEEIDACSAECEVHIIQELFNKLPPPSYDEKYVLKKNFRNRVLNKQARLGCQVVHFTFKVWSSPSLSRSHGICHRFGPIEF